MPACQRSLSRVWKPIEGLGCAVRKAIHRRCVPRPGSDGALPSKREKSRQRNHNMNGMTWCIPRLLLFGLLRMSPAVLTVVAFLAAISPGARAADLLTGLWLLPRHDPPKTARSDITANFTQPPAEIWSFGANRQAY